MIDVGRRPGSLEEVEGRYMGLLRFAPAGWRAVARHLAARMIEHLAGDPYSFDLWDAVMSTGRAVYGHAVDDQHSAAHRFMGWNCVQWPVDALMTPDGIVAALAHGRFYASTGAGFSSIGVSEDGWTIRIESNAHRLRWIERGGVVAHISTTDSDTLCVDDVPDLKRLAHVGHSFNTPADAIYVRVEAVGEHNGKAWMQPFMIRDRQEADTPHGHHALRKSRPFNGPRQDR